jgi:NADH-quinone oxidoreductase subunit E
MDKSKIEKIIDKYPNDPSSLIQVLIEIQSELRWLPKEALEVGQQEVEVP